MILGNVGGSFGFSMSPQTPALLGACCKITGHPVSLVLSYQEHQLYTGKRAPVWMNTRYACDENGKLTGIEFHAGIDHGAYSEMVGKEDPGCHGGDAGKQDLSDVGPGRHGQHHGVRRRADRAAEKVENTQDGFETWI